METKEIKKATETSANANTNKAANNNLRPSIPAKEAKNEPAKNEKPAQTAETASATGAETKAGSSPAENQQSAIPAQPAQAQQVGAPQADPSKKELKEHLNTQQVRGLDDTVKLVENLSKKIAQKNKLSNTIGNLDSFVVAQHDDKDDMASDSKFGRCELVLSDDEGNEFVTKNPFIIAYVAHEVKQLCLDKLAEVEASIVIPF